MVTVGSENINSTNLTSFKKLKLQIKANKLLKSNEWETEIEL